MNPHFLFNTLNTVASLIPEDPSKAEQVVVKLSSLFQAVLEATRKTNHSLKKELEFCRDYLDIEKSRFGARLVSRVKIEKNVDVEKLVVPVLILQPLVENAVKHGISSRAEGGHVWIGAMIHNGQLLLSVEDDGVGFGNSPYAGSGTALENCRKRLELEFGIEGTLEITSGKKGGTRMIIGLPLKKINASFEKEGRS
jgi:LytS/YehU family sensor histidine kinase